MAERKAKIMALAGKGGVGKTSLAATIVRVLTEERPGSRVLAIDADPAVGLSTALGVTVTSTLDDIRRAVIKSAEDGRPREAIEMLNESRFRILDTMVETRGFSFLAIGRPENEGCYCSVNAYLKEVVGMLAGDFDYVVIDGEAGIEQIQRRVMEKVSHLILISDQSRKGTHVAEDDKGRSGRARDVRAHRRDHKPRHKPGAQRLHIHTGRGNPRLYTRRRVPGGQRHSGQKRI